MVTKCGAPMGLKSDNAQEFKGKWWMQHLQSMAIQSEYTEAHHLHQNHLAEWQGDAQKAARVHLLTVSGAPLQYWLVLLS
jgi:hypothetical protein